MADYIFDFSGDEIAKRLRDIPNKVDKVNGKGLSTEDFTSELLAKLKSLSNYNDTELREAIAKLRTNLDTLVNGDTSSAIQSFNEVVAFLKGVEDSESLEGIIAAIEQQIAGKQDAITDLESIRDGASKGAVSVRKLKVNGMDRTPDADGVVDLGNIEGGGGMYVATLTYTATSKVENTEHPWDNNTFGAPIIRHDYDETTGVGVIYFSKRITCIGLSAFLNCSDLTSIAIPDGVVILEQNAFRNCDNLISITMPNSVSVIGQSAFRDCSSLTSITISGSVKTIEHSVFRGCSSLTSITIPVSVKTIRPYAFYGSGITSVTIPDNVTTIESSAFYYANKLTKVYCRAETPPVGATGMFNTRTPRPNIYVPMGSVEAYKSAEGWHSYVDYIFGYRFDTDFSDFYNKEEVNDAITSAITTTLNTPV